MLDDHAPEAYTALHGRDAPSGYCSRHVHICGRSVQQKAPIAGLSVLEHLTWCYSQDLKNCKEDDPDVATTHPQAADLLLMSISCKLLVACASTRNPPNRHNHRHSSPCARMPLAFCRHSMVSMSLQCA